MKQTCVYNSARDLSEVVPNLSISIKEAIQTGVVKDLGTSTDYNGIDTVSNVGSLVTNAFDAFDIQKSLKSSSRVQSTAVNNSAAAAVSEQPSA